MLDARSKYNVPVWIGETGENSNVWYAEAIQLMESQNIGWAWWPLKKLGNNNPEEIKSNPDYDKVVSYLNGNGAKPDATEAYNGLMKLANDTKAGNTVVHYDVIDAMFRQPFSIAAIPFKTHNINNGAVVNAVEYDLGRNGFAYFDNDTADYHVSKGSRGGNRGRSFRNDGVDIFRDSADVKNYYIGSTEAGEWLQYTVEVSKAGNYSVRISITSSTDKGNVSLNVDGKNTSSNIKIPAASSWQQVDLGNMKLTKGKHTIRLIINEGGFNLKNIQFDYKK
jgi:hypothetical protein